MISLEQIRLLETKVQKAVALISGLQEENAQLKQGQTESESRIRQLESIIEDFKNEQSEIEQGIVSAINRLEGLEESTKQLGIREETQGHQATAIPEQKQQSETENEADTSAQTEIEAETEINTASQSDFDSQAAAGGLADEFADESIDNEDSEAETLEKDEKQEDELELF